MRKRTIFSLIVMVAMVAFVTLASCEKEEVSGSNMGLGDAPELSTLKASGSTYDGEQENFASSMPAYFNTLEAGHWSDDYNYTGSGTGVISNKDETENRMAINITPPTTEPDEFTFNYSQMSVASGKMHGYWLHVSIPGASIGSTTIAYYSRVANNWYTYAYDMKTPIQNILDTYSKDWDDITGISVSLWQNAYTEFCVDNFSIDAVYQSPSCTVSGPSSAYVVAAQLPSYTATFSAGCSGYYAYQWTVHSGSGTIVGSSTGSSVTVDFDAYGGNQISLKVKQYSTQSWSSATLKSHTVFPRY